MTSAAGASTPTDRPGQIYLYFAPLTLLVYLVLPNGYLVDFVTAYMLKNQLHATAIQVSEFRVLTAIPVYLAFIFRPHARSLESVRAPGPRLPPPCLPRSARACSCGWRSPTLATPAFWRACCWSW